MPTYIVTSVEGCLDAPKRAKIANGQIRAGRSVESKDSLIAQILTAVAEASNLSKRNVWIYITDLVPRQMVEFGHVLPEAGDEARWAAALPEADRAHMQSFALQH